MRGDSVVHKDEHLKCGKTLIHSCIKYSEVIFFIISRLEPEAELSISIADLTNKLSGDGYSTIKSSIGKSATLGLVSAFNRLTKLLLIWLLKNGSANLGLGTLRVR